MCDINTTPLIDVMLVLLVTLIVSLPDHDPRGQARHAAIRTQPPPPDTAPGGHRSGDRLRRHGRLERHAGDRACDQLEGYFHNEAAKDPQPEIHLRPDRRAKYDVVAKVLAAAQRNRMKKIGFVNTSEFGD